ncbi:glycosyltransferase [Escherichia coli]|nr:glycosyltransferase [Escherichia coli]
MSIYHGDNIDYISTAVNSILKQTYPCSIYLYIDGPVSKRISMLLEDLAKNNKSIKLFRSKINNGLAHALNTMIDYAMADGCKYIARMDSDDISRPTRIAKQIEYLERNKEIDILGTSCREFGASYALSEKHLPMTHDELVTFSLTRCPFIHPTVIFRSNVFKSGIRYPTNTKLTEDMALWLKLIEDGYHLANINEVLLDYRLNEDAVKRRKGLYKALSEFTIRINHMRTMNRHSPKNFLFISLRLIFHILPLPIIKILYKFAR